MPIGGENVGTAYVRILADGGDLDDSIADQMDNIDWDKMGRKSSKEWSEGFEDEQKKAPNQTKLRDAIAGTLARGDWLTQTFFRSKNWTNFRSSMEKEFGDAGKLAAQSLEEDLFNGLDFDGLDRRLDNLTADLVKARKTLDAQLSKQTQQTLDEAYAMNVEFNKRVLAAEVKLRQDRDKQWDLHLSTVQDTLDEAYAMNVEFNKRVDEDEVKLRLDRDKQWDLHLSTVQDTLEEAYRMNVDFNKRVTEEERQLRLDRDKQLDIHLQRTRAYYEEAYDLNAKFDKASHEALRRQAIDHQHLHPILRQTIRTSDRLTESIARVFGKGSRSEFLNVFGRSVGALSSLLVLPLKAFSGLLSIGGKVSDMFEGGFSKGIVKLTASFGLLAVGAAGLTVLLGGVFVAVGVLTSALLSLAGAAVAVASSLTFALAGGAVVALGALVPLAAGIGVATLAIMNMDEETKKAFDGIGKSFKALGTDAAGNIFNSAAKDAEALEEAVKGLSVITGPVSKALGGLLDEFIDSLSDPALVNFQAFLGRTLPGMVTSLGHIVGNFGEIFMGIWIAITPFVQRFLDWFSQVTQEFANWVNSAEGKNTIRQFLEDAFDSAESLGGALEEIIGLIGDLFGVSRETGDSIFDTLAGKVEEWRAALNRAKEDGVIQQWFRDAKETTDEIGRMVEAIGKFADAMDTPENRETVRQLTGLFDDLLLIIETLAPVFVSAFHSMGIAIEPVATAIRQTKAAFKDFGGTVRTIYNSMIGPAFSQILKAIGGVLGKMGDLFGALASVKGAPDWIGKTADALHGAEDQTNQLADAIRTIPDADIKVTGPSDATINKIEAQLAGLSRPRTATITVNTLLTGHPGPGAGGQDDRGVTAVTTPTTSNPGGKPTTGQGGNSRTVNANGWQIVTPTKDPEAVAAEVLNRLAGAGY